MSGRVRPDEVVLALRASGLGDLLTAAPALRASRRAFPGRVNVLATSPWLCDLARSLDLADAVVPQHELTPLSTRRVAIAIDLHGRGPESHRALLASEPRELWAFRHPEIPRSDAGPEWRADEHEIQRWLRLVRWYGVDTTPGSTSGPRRRHHEPSGPTVIHPGAGAPARRWPVRRWGHLARRLTASGHRVVVTGSTAERPLAERVCGRALLGPARNLAGRYDLLQLSDLVRSARLVITGDTGVAHLATEWGTPSVILFGPSSPAIWGPRSGPHLAIWHGRTGDPHAQQIDPGLASITIAEVLDAVESVERAPLDGRPVSLTR